MKSIIFILCLLLSFPASAAELVIHEWGTFTSLQDEKGEAIPGVNTDDEPVPGFVHGIGNLVINGQSELTPAILASTTKGGIPRLHPDVTMRLETPVVYFYLPKGMDRLKLDLDVSFRRGWLSQYYPDAIADTSYTDVMTKHITADTVGKLSWKGLEIGGNGQGPATSDNVWLAPRNVEASPVTTATGETEKFLFYRGVGKLGTEDFPMIAGRDKEGVSLTLNYNISDAMRYVHNWLVDVRADGSLAFRAGGKSADVSKNVVRYGQFSDKDYSAKNLPLLKKELHAALVGKGLYDDEATAMLNTWEHSYFKSPGERIFYIVPNSWIDNALPLKVSVPAEVTRVMVGRIELVSAGQQAALARMKQDSAGGVADFIGKSVAGMQNWQLYQDVSAGKKPIVALGADVPAIYKDYLQLGRFRDAIVLNENAKNAEPVLASFIKDTQIGMYEVQ